MNITLFLSFFACNSSTAKSSAGDEIKSTPPQEQALENTETAKTEKTTKPEKTMVKGKKGLPDLRVGLNKSGCDNGPGVYGASSYYIGEFTVSDGRVTGTEKWLLFPNKKRTKKDRSYSDIEVYCYGFAI